MSTDRCLGLIGPELVHVLDQFASDIVPGAVTWQVRTSGGPLSTWEVGKPHQSTEVIHITQS